MKRATGKIFKIIGFAYVLVVFLAMMSGYVTYGMEHGFWEALRTFQEEWSPFAVLHWATRFVIFLPGVVLYFLGEKLRGAAPE